MGAQKASTPEQIIRKLREAEVELAKGATIAQVAKKLEITDHKYYRWRAEYGGRRVGQEQLRLGGGHCGWQGSRSAFAAPDP